MAALQEGCENMGTRWQGRTAVTVVVSGLSMLGAMGAPRPASAQVPPSVSEQARDEARHNYRAGETKFQQGDYAGALGLYEQADAIVPIPLTKYKIAVCHDRLGQVRDAVRWYQIFLDTPGSERRPSEVQDAKTRLASLPRPMGQVHITLTPPGPPQLTYSIDNGPAQPSPPSFSLPAGHHRIVVQAQGFNPAVAEVDVSESQPKELSIALSPASGPPGQATVTGTETQDLPQVRYRGPAALVPGIVLLGVGVVAAGVGTGFGVAALNDKSSFDKKPTSATADRTSRDGLVSDVSFATALALGVTGAVLLITSLPGAARETASRGFVTPYAGPTGGGVVGGLSF